MRLVAIVALAALPLASCGGEEEPPVMETEVVAEGEEDAASSEPADRSLADPAPTGPTEPVAGAASGLPPDTPVASDDAADPEAVGEQYPDYVGGETD